MKNNKCFLLFTFILLILFVDFSRAQSGIDSDESAVRRFEIGGQFTVLRRTDANPVRETLQRFFGTTTAPGKITELGLGGRLTYNFTKNIAVEAEANFFPDDKQQNAAAGMPILISEPGGRKFQTLFGPKIGIRTKSFGVFGKARPGFIRLDRYEVVQQVGTPAQFFILSSVKNNVYFFNADVGGVFEYYPTRKSVFRIDVGDTIVRYNSQEPKAVNPGFTRHNLQTGVGVGFRF